MYYLCYFVFAGNSVHCILWFEVISYTLLHWTHELSHVTIFQNRNWAVCDQSGNQVVYEFGKTVMDSMPPHAIVLTKGDLSSNVIRSGISNSMDWCCGLYLSLFMCAHACIYLLAICSVIDTVRNQRFIINVEKSGKDCLLLQKAFFSTTYMN